MGLGSARYNSITPQEKKLVMDTWTEIRPQMRDFSVSLFLLMLNDYPHFANYWAFRGPQDDSFDRFTSQFIREFDTMVMLLNRPNSIYPILRKNAIYHIPKRIPSEDYDRLRKCIVSVISDHIGEQSKRHDAIKAWVKCISICFSFITEMTEDIAAEQERLQV